MPKKNVINFQNNFDFVTLTDFLCRLIQREVGGNIWDYKELNLLSLLSIADKITETWEWSYSPIDYTKPAIVALEKSGVDKHKVTTKLAYVLTKAKMWSPPPDVNPTEWRNLLEKHQLNYTRALTTLSEAFSAIMFSEIDTEFKAVSWLMEHETKVILFDADGTLTPLREGSLGAFDFRLMPNVEKTIKEIQSKLPQIQIGIVSNQSGKRDYFEIIAQLAWTAGRLNIHWDAVNFTYVDRWKKPNTHMADELLSEFNVQFTGDKILVVGDRERDNGGLAANLGAYYIHPEKFFNW